MKKNIIILAVAILVLVVFSVQVVRADSSFWDKVANIAGSIIGNAVVNQELNGNLGASEDGDSNFTNVVASGDLTVSGDTTLATTTVANSYDGFTLYKSLSIATGTTQTVFCNTATGKELVCQGAGLAVDVTNTNLYTSALYFVLGTSTSATYSASLIASSTISTTTPAKFITADSNASKPFKLDENECVTARFGDIYSSASSTYFTNVTAEVEIPCTMLGQ